ncbi:hypothetical protein RFI_08210 [Reticulomyxa filosa]|uniref:NADAR domain-containing protein n=1 Tax=Reticulomyxa filosa TaxID=46433 RepID=X6NT60_RETFI|nr:hypothetical protein RFI_08210 [Reticulomyxa filosa]|eukprot:ETO28919.1 hypothetical protein RFI_08210 [Reticulomyxa filosa]
MAQASKQPWAEDKNVRVTDKYVLFYSGEFSQFHRSEMIIDKAKFFCAEQYMMSAKAQLFKDQQSYEYIVNQCKTPPQCKNAGRKVKNFDETVWNKHREDIVFKGNYEKFKQNEKLRQLLFSYSVVENGDNKAVTMRTFVEAAPSDRIWGIGLAVNNEKAADEKNWDGLNLLGKCITRARDQLWTEQNSAEKK